MSDNIGNEHLTCTSPPRVATLLGEVFYLQPITLPATAILSVQLQDVSFEDAEAVVLAHQTTPVAGKLPLPFRLNYDPTRIEPGHRYAVMARIELEGKLLFINTWRQSVTLDGQDPQPLRIQVDPAR